MRATVGMRPAARALAGDRLQDAGCRGAVRSDSDYMTATPINCGNLRADKVYMSAGRGWRHD